MAFTYDPSLPADRDRVRRFINDVVENSGPLPSDLNFQDAELDAVVTLEGAWQRAVAACFEMLAAAWSKYPSHTADGVSISNSDVSRKFQEQAEKWRDQYGGSPTGMIAVASKRWDGYADDYGETGEDEYP